MKIVSNLLAFYRMENNYEPHDNDYWRLRLINIFLSLITFVYLFFIVFNLSMTKLYANAVIDVIGLFTVHAIILNYRRKKSVQETSHYIVISVFILSAAIILISDKNYGILFWSIFLPIFAMLLMGQRVGLYYSFAYYALIFSHLLLNISPSLTVHTVVEFIVVSTILIAIIYYYELSRIQAYQQLKRQALQDPLTGLYNRRYFDSVFESDFNRLKRSEEHFAFCMIDIDNFKLYNDNYGHQAGDQALKAVADILKAYLRRSGDISFRLGGEEFGALISVQDKEHSIQYIEQIRRAIQGMGIEHGENGECGVVTASFGFVLINHYEGLNPELAYKMADQALYRAKASGRNCVESLIV